MANKRKGRGKGGKWNVPKNAADFFDPHYDDAFKARHPILYWLTVIAIIVSVCVGPITYILLASTVQEQFNNPSAIVNGIELIIWVIGMIASAGISIGLCNLLMILHKQYLGHWVTLISFAIGIFGSGFCLILLWLI